MQTILKNATSKQFVFLNIQINLFQSSQSADTLLNANNLFNSCSKDFVNTLSTSFK